MTEPPAAPAGAGLRGLLHDRRFLIPAALVAAVGGYVLYRKSQSGSSATAGTADQVAASGSAAPGIDTTGSDLGSISDELLQHDQQLSTAITALQQLGQGPAGTGTGGPTPVPSGVSTLSVPLGTSIYDWTRQVGTGYQVAGGFDINKLRALNPGIDQHITWVQGPGGKIPEFKPGTGPVRIR